MYWLYLDTTYFELLLKKIKDPSKELDEIIKEVKNSLNPGGLIGPDGRRGDLRGFFLERYGSSGTLSRREIW
ncbi:MAG: hypothetical protein H5T40_05370 [Methanobacteriales archaeon]|nr:hypothetical protein [Methanobacteriales archaeon]